ncbi:DUF998 domain-containing protein [Streptomyces sp. NPDC090025]|uniref:DUF998 domain-containing protein n=1 Tax=Streptomyces sp. NPDC090025 TaxID=3365922 RepID=UPI003835AAF6
MTHQEPSLVRRSEAASPSDRRGAVTICLVVGAVLYNVWPVEFFVATGLDPVSGFLSELEAMGRPYRWVFATGDALAGALFTVGGVIGLCRARSRADGAWARIRWIALALFGVSTCLFAVLAPMDCAPSVDVACRLTEQQAGMSPRTLAHVLLSGAADVAVLLAMTAGRWPRAVCATGTGTRRPSS